MTHQEIHEQLPDYVLGLLTPDRANEVAQHIAGCTTCLRKVHDEREIGALVREALNTATRPDTAQLRQLMPPIPQKKHPRGTTANWTTRLAPALILLVVILGSLLMTAPESKRSMSIFFATTATATSTNTPTATVVQNSRGDDNITPAVTERFVSDLPAYESEPVVQVIAAPAPLHSPTPIAAVSSTTTN
ncbi:MAG: anti-sigma factor family protein [Candidatus Promineifilaceae bacterium]|jgi:anti-sigma factor RsiW